MPLYAGRVSRPSLSSCAEGMTASSHDMRYGFRLHLHVLCLVEWSHAASPGGIVQTPREGFRNAKCWFPREGLRLVKLKDFLE
jgi:hypothetical protein